MIVEKRNFTINSGHERPILADLIYHNDGTSKPVLIFVHGFKGYKDWGTFNMVSQQWAEAGFVVVKFNFSHNGGTKEQPIDFPDLEAFGNNNYSLEQHDLGAVINWCSSIGTLPDEADANRIYLVGHSRGGGAVLLKGAHDARVKKIVTWAAVSDYGARFEPYDIEAWKKEGVIYIVNGRTKQNMPLYFQFYEDFKANEAQLDIPVATKKLQQPLLICHGTNDPAVGIEEAHALKSWKSDAELFILEGAGHTFEGKHPWEETGLPENLQKVVDRTIAFLK